MRANEPVVYVLVLTMYSSWSLRKQRRREAKERTFKYIEFLEYEIRRLGGDVCTIEDFARLSAVGQDARPDLFSSSSTTGLEHKTEASNFYIGDEEEPADEAADAKENRRKEIVTQWKELEKMEVRLGLPIRRGRKWLRRHNLNVEVELEAAGREKAMENAAPEAENVVVEFEATGREDAAENAAQEAENVEKPKADVPKKKRRMYGRKRCCCSRFTS